MAINLDHLESALAQIFHKTGWYTSPHWEHARYLNNPSDKSTSGNPAIILCTHTLPELSSSSCSAP